MLNIISADISKAVKALVHTRSSDKHGQHLFSLNDSTALSRAKKEKGVLKAMPGRFNFFMTNQKGPFSDVPDRVGLVMASVN
jgi:hypothetical protein